eukprot:TRINITY_DN8588_c0_g1_i1.p1 TRINITY_DN8588_c0_g1~~TRINITY_DN8588_c0_g1_i1.p1  ORF type:complete len:208 (-),score=28.29 TRINITY_DN8588_c0_g1_i1:340-906(-)
MYSPRRGICSRACIVVASLAALVFCFDHRAWVRADRGQRTGVFVPLPEILDFKLSDGTFAEQFQVLLKDYMVFAEAFNEAEVGWSRLGDGLTASAGLNAGVHVKPVDPDRLVPYVGAYVQARKNYFNRLGLKKQTTAFGVQAGFLASKDSDGKTNVKFMVSPHIAQTQSWNLPWKALFRKAARKKTGH